MVRAEDWRVLHTTVFGDCQAIDVASEDRAGVTRTFLLPFDHVRPSPPRRLALVSTRRWCQHVAATVAGSFPFGGLRFCPGSIRILPYQLEPALAVLRYAATRLLIADEVGVGKTVEAGLLIREVLGARHTSRILILTPSSLRDQWRQELVTLFAIDATEADAGWLRRASVSLPADVNPWSLPGVYLASIDFVKRPEALHPLEAVRWDLLVIDEAHGATPGSHRRAAVDALACRSRVVVLLTATPHTGDARQFAELCATGRVDARESLVCFRRSRADLQLLGGAVKSRVIRVNLPDADRRVHRELEAYASRLWAASDRGRGNPALLATILRKRALSSTGTLVLSLQRRLRLMESPAPIETQLWLPLEDEDTAQMDDLPAEHVLGGPGLSDSREERMRIERILDAAAPLSDADGKMRTLRRLLRRIREPAIVFSEYRDTVDRLHDTLAADGHRVIVLHGGLAAADRRAAVTEFNRGGALLVATDAASEGLNLHHRCRLVVHFELPWTPSRLHQRLGRVHRIGQPLIVHQVALVANDTAEELVIEPLVRRERQAGRFSGGSLVTRLSEARVAAHVIGGAVLDATGPDADMPANVITMDLGREAAIEAERLELLRRVQREPPAGAERRPLLPAARVGRRGQRRDALTLIVSATIRDRSGTLLEEQVFAVTGRLPGRALRPRRNSVRKELAALLEHIGKMRRLRFGTRRRLSDVRSMYRTVRRAAAERERAIEREVRSAARELVQAGLFDRVPLRTGPRSADRPAIEESGSGAEVDAAWGLLRARVRVCAVLRGSLE